MRRRAGEAGPMEAVVRDQQEAVWCNGTGARRLFRLRTFRAARYRRCRHTSINIETSSDFVAMFAEWRVNYLDDGKHDGKQDESRIVCCFDLR